MISWANQNRVDYDTVFVAVIAHEIEQKGYWRHPDPAIGVMRPHSVSISAFLTFALFVVGLALIIAGFQRNQLASDEEQLRVEKLSNQAHTSQIDMLNSVLQQQVTKENACEIRTLNYRKALIEANDTAQEHARTDPYAASISRVLAHLKALLN